MFSASSSNFASRLIRLFGLGVLVVMSLIPPWQLRYSLRGQAQSISAGYHPLWSPPVEEVELPEGAADPAHRINVLRLGIQLVAVLVLMNGSLSLVKKSRS